VSNKEELNEKKGKGVFIDDMFFNVYAMQKLIKQDNFLSQKFRDKTSVEAIYGYHSNENILNELFRDYVLPKNLNPLSVGDAESLDNSDSKLSTDDNYDRFQKYREIRGWMEKAKAHKKSKKLEETTAAGGGAPGSNNTGQYSSPIAWAKNSKTARFAKGDKSGSNAYQDVVKVNPKTHVQGVDSADIIRGKIEASKMIKKKEVNEEAKSFALQNKDRVTANNPKNFKADLKAQAKGIEDMANGKSNVMSYDYDKDSVKPKDLQTGASVTSNDDTEQIMLNRGGGMEDLKYDREPSQKFKDRQKKDLGEKVFNNMIAKRKFMDGETRYDKEPQPVKIVKESLSGYFIDKFGKKKFVDLNISEVTEIKSNENLNKFITEGMGNSFNELLNEQIQGFDFYINEKGQGFKTVKKVISSATAKPEKNEELEAMKKLMNYKPSKFLK